MDGGDGLAQAHAAGREFEEGKEVALERHEALESARQNLEDYDRVWRKVRIVRGVTQIAVVGNDKVREVTFMAGGRETRLPADRVLVLAPNWPACRIRPAPDCKKKNVAPDCKQKNFDFRRSAACGAENFSVKA